MKKYLVLTFWLLSVVVMAQSAVNYQEELMVFTNASNYLVGEDVNVSIRCKSNLERNECLSKVVHIELISESGKSVLKHLYSLEEGGIGGSFFIPSTLPSGNYQLAVYSKWNLNNTHPNLFRKTISILNPFLRFSPAAIDTKHAGNPTPAVLSTFQSNETCRINLDSLLLLFKDENPIVGIRLMSNINQTKGDDTSHENGDFVLNYVPDFRGVSLEGKSAVKDTLSIFNESTGYMQLVPTNNEGDWVAIIETDKTDELKIQASAKSSVDLKYPSVSGIVDTPAKLQLKLSDRKEIEQRLKYVQVINAFKHTAAKDSIHFRPIYAEPDNVYDLSDYNDFPTVAELFREIIEGVKLRESDGKQLIAVADDKMNFLRYKPLVLVNSIPINALDDLHDIHPSQISRIEVLRNTYAINGIFFGGVVNIIGENLNHLRLKGAYLTIPQLVKNIPAKEISPSSDLPDYRTQLYWGPVKEGGRVEFFTSQVKGIFEVSINGMDLQGKPHTIYTYIEVE